MLIPTASGSIIIASSIEPPGPQTMDRATFPLPEPERYEIRPLQLEDADAASAIIAHGATFDSPLWAPIHDVGNKSTRAYHLWRAIRPLACRYIQSGLSYGVFDT